MEPVAVKQSAGKTLGFLVFAGAMLAASLLVYRLLTPAWIGMLVGGVACLFFGAAFLYLLYRLIRPKAVLLLTEEGFTDPSPAWGPGLAPWPQVEGIFSYNIANQKFIGCSLKE